MEAHQLSCKLIGTRVSCPETMGYIFGNTSLCSIHNRNWILFHESFSSFLFHPFSFKQGIHWESLGKYYSENLLVQYAFIEVYTLESSFILLCRKWTISVIWIPEQHHEFINSIISIVATSFISLCCALVHGYMAALPRTFFRYFRIQFSGIFNYWR